MTLAQVDVSGSFVGTASVNLLKTFCFLSLTNKLERLSLGNIFQFKLI